MLQALDKLDDAVKGKLLMPVIIGGKGGGMPSRPKEIPTGVWKKYERQMEDEYADVMEAAGYDPGDDPLSFSETDYGEAWGFAFVHENGKLKDNEIEDISGGIQDRTIKPVPLKYKGKKAFLYGGYDML